MSVKFCTKGIYADGMVLQRNTINCIFGEAEPGATVEMFFFGQNGRNQNEGNMRFSASADTFGKWKIEFNPGKEGGPFKIELKSGNEKLCFSDVYVGEVWVSSGQSNAQLPMERLKYTYSDEFTLPENPNIRMITVPIDYSFDGEKDSVNSPKWICASPSTLALMSGTAYFFAKKLNAELGVPVGIVNASQGGSPISAWMDGDTLKRLEENHKINPEAGHFTSRLENCKNPEFVQNAKADIKKRQDEWNSKIYSLDEGYKNKWESLDFSTLDDSWKNCTIPNDFDADVTGLEEAGTVWFKKEVELSSEQASLINSNKIFIWLGTILDADCVWVNGVKVGITYYLYPPRRYEIPKDTMHEGKNTITIRVQKNGKGPLRFYKEKPYFIFTEGAAIEPVAVRNVEGFECFADGQKSDGIVTRHANQKNAVLIELAGSWKMKTGCSLECYPGELFFEWEPSALYNSMLAPAFNYAVRGAIWYQGESDAERYYDYSVLLQNMISLWRKKFVYAPKDMPFVILQLPNWSDGHGETSAQKFSDWAELREAQKEVCGSDLAKDVALSVNIDAGEWNDLHPEKKKTCGTRAAMQALRVAYGRNDIPCAVTASGSFEKNDNAWIISLESLDVHTENSSGAEFKLAAYKTEGKTVNYNENSKSVSGFSVLFDDETVCEVSAKLIENNKVRVDFPSGKDYTSIKELRYLWAQNPAPVNLYVITEACKNADSSDLQKKSCSLIPDMPVAPFRIKLQN